MFTTPTSDRASFGQRLVGALIDGVLLGVLSVFLRGFFGSLLSILIGLGYYIYLEGSPSGQTLGKKVMQIRVVDIENGGSIGYGRAGVRYVARFLSALPLALGYFWMLWDPERQTWHDKLAACVVVPEASAPVERWPG